MLDAIAAIPSRSGPDSQIMAAHRRARNLRGIGARGAEAPPAESPGVTVSISPEARARAEESEAAAPPGRPTGQDGEALSERDAKEVDRLAERDREVRTHEQAHASALGAYARGGPQFSTTTGPDGRRYVTGGHVSVDMSRESEPERTISKMQTIRRAALAPADPSGADRQAAAQASSIEQQARAELGEASRGGDQASLEGEGGGEGQEEGEGESQVEGAAGASFDTGALISALGGGGTARLG